MFPYLRKRFGFQNIAQLCGNWYMPIFTWDKPVDNVRMHAPRFKWKCDLMSSPDTNHEEECDQVRGTTHAPPHTYPPPPPPPPPITPSLVLLFVPCAPICFLS